MKNLVCLSFRRLAIAGIAMLATAAFAQETPAESSPAPARTEDIQNKDTTDAAPPDETKAETAATVESSTAPADEADSVPEPSKEEVAAAEAVVPATKAAPAPRPRLRHGRPAARVSFWKDSIVMPGEEVDVAVSLLGSSTVEGKVRDAVVSIFGSSRVSGGSIGGPVVSVFGNTYVDAEVKDVVVSILGRVELGPNAVVHDEVVSVGGGVRRAPGAEAYGQIHEIAFGESFDGLDSLHAWVAQCLRKGRLLAFGSNLMWAWWIGIAFVGFYGLLALLFPRGVEKCAITFEQSPGYSVLTAVLVTLLTPLLMVLVAITVVGAPVLGLALFVAGLFGKTVMLAWMGRRLTTRFDGGVFAAPAMAVLVGGVILLLLYTVPIGGLIVAKLTSWLGLGIVVYTVLQSGKRPEPAVAAATANPAATPVAGLGGGGPVSGTSASVAPPAVAGAVPPVIGVADVALPRAGFWIRIAASLIDLLIVAVIFWLIPRGWRPNAPLLVAIYCLMLWGLKGTTIGGIICGLKIVRLDDRPVDWPTAIVRTLGGFLSLVAAGIGFLWTAFDDEKQSWHDKIAGTTIVRVPRGISLV